MFTTAITSEIREIISQYPVQPTTDTGILYGILAGYWVIISRISLVIAVVNISLSFSYSSIRRLVVILHQLDLLNHSSSL